MASQNTNQQDETAIDKMNSQLTAAGDKIANNKKSYTSPPERSSWWLL